MANRTNQLGFRYGVALLALAAGLTVWSSAALISTDWVLWPYGKIALSGAAILFAVGTTLLLLSWQKIAGIRWHQFRLRTVLVVTALIAIPLAWLGNEWRQSQYEKRISETFAPGATSSVTLAGPYDSHDLYNARDPQGWWREFARKVVGQRIMVMIARDGDIDDLTPLAGLSNVQILFLEGTEVSDLSPLAGLTSLGYLRLNDTKVSDILPLTGLKNLRKLTLNGTAITQEQVDALQKALPNCEIQFEPIP